MMMVLGRGPWRLVLDKNSSDGKFRYRLIDYSQFARAIVVEGVGKASKKEALENLLETWRGEQTELECPARSREELELKLALLDVDHKKPKEKKA